MVEICYSIFNSLKELVVRDPTKESERPSRIIPGDWGKIGPGWLTQPYSSAGRKARGAETEFTSSSGGVRAPSVNAKKKLVGQKRAETASSQVK
jgi:hypothetical protein